MKTLYFISLFVLCSLFHQAVTHIQLTSPYTLPSVASGYLDSITLVQQESGGYVFNMTQNGDYIQPATASSPNNFSASFSLSSSLTVINSASLSGVSTLADASDGSVASYLPYLDIYINNAVDLDVYLGLWLLTDYCKTFDETTSSLPSSLEPQAEAYIGLGTSSSFSSSYSQTKVSTPIFSVSVGESTAELIFGTDMTKATSETPVATFYPIMGPMTSSTNPTDWTFEVNSLQSGSSTFDLTGVTAAFDLNINGILMPPATYTDIISHLCSAYCSSCGTTQDDRNLTTCNISSPSLLPSLAINMNNDDDDQDASDQTDSMSFTNSASIPVSPEAYTFSETIDGQNYTVFNFISDTNNGGWLIIGSQAMSLFYTVFSSSTKSINYGFGSVPCYTITLYQANQASAGDSDSSDDTGVVFQAYSIAAALANSDSETENSESSDDVSDSDGNLFVSLSNAQNLTAAVQQNYQRVVQLQKMVATAGHATSTSSGFASILSDINQGIEVVEPFLETLGIFTGLGPVTSIVGSILSVFGIGGGSAISAQLNELSQEIAVVSEQVDDLAQEIVTSAQEITQMLNVISDDIAQVYTKVSDLQSQQTAYFSTILTDDQADVCYAEISSYASTIIGGMQALQALSNITDPSQIDGFRTNFQDTCSFCPFALEGLLNAFNPESEEGGCDIISILTAGNATYHRNWQLSIAGSGGYLISLINMGITVVSALESIQTNSSDAWMAVVSSNNASYQQAVQSLQSAVAGCYETYFQDAQWNVLNYTQEYPATATMGEITQLLSLLYPWKGWIVLSLSIDTTQSGQINYECLDTCDGQPVTVDNEYSLKNTGQSFTVDLQTNGSIIIQPFDLQNPLGLTNDNTEWIWQPSIQTCLSNPTGPLVEFCNSLAFLSTYVVVPSSVTSQELSGYGVQQQLPSTGILTGGQFGTNVITSTGAVYSFTELTDSEIDEIMEKVLSAGQNSEEAELGDFALGFDDISTADSYLDASTMPHYMGIVSSSSGQVFFWPNA